MSTGHRGRRREDSGTLPLDQVLSYRSSLESLPGDLRQSSETRRLSHTRRTSSKLRDSSSAGRETLSFLDEPNNRSLEHAKQANSPNSSSSSLPYVSASSPTTVSSAKPGLHTVISGQGVSLSNALPADTPILDEPVAGPSSQPSQESPSPETTTSDQAVEASDPVTISSAQLAPDHASAQDTEAPAGVAGCDDADMAADLDWQMSDDKCKHKHRQHPWLLYFYDKSSEADYAKYHATQMLKVSRCGNLHSSHNTTVLQHADCFAASLRFFFTPCLQPPDLNLTNAEYN